jgi:hypothetical protein
MIWFDLAEHAAAFDRQLASLMLDDDVIVVYLDRQGSRGAGRRSKVVTGSRFQIDRQCYTAEQVEVLQGQTQQSGSH